MVTFPHQELNGYSHLSVSRMQHRVKINLTVFVRFAVGYAANICAAVLSNLGCSNDTAHYLKCAYETLYICMFACPMYILDFDI